MKHQLSITALGLVLACAFPACADSAHVFQIGDSNQCNVQQYNNNSATAVIVQWGTLNAASTDQHGHSVIANVMQVGAGNVAIVAQN